VSRYSIGEVLNRLKGEFDDITISKIRFLEAEGLISPDRTDSGYRKFTDEDVERLRHVLRAQRDRYLPLKVIRDELERLDAGEPAGLPEQLGVLDVGPEETRDEAAGSVPVDPAPRRATTVPTDVQLSGRELAEAVDLDLPQVRALQEHGLLPAGDRFDGEAVAAARAARGLLVAGLEPRHLRMYRQFADREVGLLGQLVQPMLRQRNPAARAGARTLLDGLAADGTALHAALLRRALREILDE
jgi:DNA-binding transcriptional MerR regulator